MDLRLLRVPTSSDSSAPKTPPASTLFPPKPYLKRNPSLTSVSSRASEGLEADISEPEWTEELDGQLRALSENVLRDVAHTGTPFTGRTPPPQIVHVIARAAVESPSWPASLSSTRARVRFLARQSSMSEEESLPPTATTVKSSKASHLHRRSGDSNNQYPNDRSTTPHVDATPKRRRRNRSHGNNNANNDGSNRPPEWSLTNSDEYKPRTIAALCSKLHRLQPERTSHKDNAMSFRNHRRAVTTQQHQREHEHDNTGHSRHQRSASDEATQDYFSLHSLAELKIEDDSGSIAGSTDNASESSSRNNSPGSSTTSGSSSNDPGGEKAPRPKLMRAHPRPPPLILSTTNSSSSLLQASSPRSSSPNGYDFPSPVDPSLNSATRQSCSPLFISSQDNGNQVIPSHCASSSLQPPQQGLSPVSATFISRVPSALKSPFTDGPNIQ